MKGHDPLNVMFLLVLTFALLGGMWLAQLTGSGERAISTYPTPTLCTTPPCLGEPPFRMQIFFPVVQR